MDLDLVDLVAVEAVTIVGEEAAAGAADVAAGTADVAVDAEMIGELPS
ncbi:MAG: hypothetical protein QG646_3122 [Euryarchaeota archaeon]|nr:hypothetical protein [Euryarchaeota archaeon]